MRKHLWQIYVAVPDDPACWPKHWSFASSNLDRRMRRVCLCPSPWSTSRTCKRRNGAAAADRTPTPKSVTEPPITSRVRLKNSQEPWPVLSQCTQDSQASRNNLNVRTSEVRWELLYTWALSLSWQLHIWTRGSHPTVHVPSSGASLTWALLLTLLWLSYLCTVYSVHRCLGARSLLDGEFGCLRTHLPCGLAGRLHDLPWLLHSVSGLSPKLILWPTGKWPSAFIFGDVLISAISNHLVAWIHIWRLHLQLGDRRF